MNNQTNKPSLPSIKDLLEGGPGLIDYSNCQHQQQQQYEEQPNKYKSHLSRHRRHVSEHITTTTITNPPSTSVLQCRIHNNETLPIKMQSLSLEEEEQDKPTTSSSRARTHSRSYSDFTHPYPRSNNHIDLVTTHASTTIIDDTTTEAETKEEPPPPPTDNKYICPYCSKGFTRPSSLRTHTYSHTGEKPFICTEPCCGRKFSVQSNLRRHLRVHRLSKPSPLFLPKNIK